MKKTVLIGILVLVIGLALCLVVKSIQNKPGGQVTDQSIPPDSTDELWFKNSVIYTLDVEVFNDSDGDGVGDFKGLIQRLGYIDSLGADVIWLAPFQPTPNKDDGYDVSDFYGIDTRLGDVNDFKAFMEKATTLGFKVIMDIVLNHTSIAHPWFQQARADQNSPYRSWYVWSKERPKKYDEGMVFPGVQEAIWTYDSVAKAYYYHRFYKFQPDLNAQHPAVQAEAKKIIKHWMDFGLAGFRLDAVPFFIEIATTGGEEFERRFDMLSDLRSYLKTLRNNAIILGEANVMPDETEPYFGKNGEAMNMMFNFYVNQHLFYALATGKVKPLHKALQATEQIPKSAQWGQFLRNHDELDLGRLSNKERNEVYQQFGPEKSMQLYDRGIRRRLAPMMNNNTRQIQLAYNVLFSLPSTPVMRYGDEIGMGEALELEERESVRTPMQWNGKKNAGFSTAVKLVKPVIDTGTFAYQQVNVEVAAQHPSSLLNWTKKLIQQRKETPEIAYGSRKILDTHNDHVLAIKYNWQGKTVLVVNNFSNQPQQMELPVGEVGGTQLKSSFPKDEEVNATGNNMQLSLQGYGYRWFRVGE